MTTATLAAESKATCAVSADEVEMIAIELITGDPFGNTVYEATFVDPTDDDGYTAAMEESVFPCDACSWDKPCSTCKHYDVHQSYEDWMLMKMEEALLY